MTDYVKAAVLGTEDYDAVMQQAAAHAIFTPDVPHLDLNECQEIPDLIEIGENGHGGRFPVIRLEGYCWRCSAWLTFALKKDGIVPPFVFWGKIKAGSYCPRCDRKDRWNGIERKDGIYT